MTEFEIKKKGFRREWIGKASLGIIVFAFVLSLIAWNFSAFKSNSSSNIASGTNPASFDILSSDCWVDTKVGCCFGDAGRCLKGMFWGGEGGI